MADAALPIDDHGPAGDHGAPLAATSPVATAVEVPDKHGAGHAEPELLGLVPFQWVSVAMAVLLLIAFGWLKVHRTIAGGLDARIAAIRAALEEASQLRAEAEALRDEYASRSAGLKEEAEAMLDNARKEAETIVAAAEQRSADMIARRERMAQDKIAAAERQALADLQARAATAATAAAAALIAARHDAAADALLADQAIAQI